MDFETEQLITTAKLPTLKQGEYEMWRLRIEPYFQVQDYALWDVIENGNSFQPTAKTTTNADGTSTTLIPGPVTADEKIRNKNDVKARSMLLMALPNEHLMTFNQYKDAKTLFAAIQTRFGGNEATKKTQKTLLKQMYDNFKDLNLKFLRSLPSEWNTYVVVWRNKPDLDIMSFNDLYNNFKIVEQEVKGTTSLSSSSSSQNLAFVSSTSSTNEVNTASTRVSTANTQVSSTSTQVSTANLSDDIVYAFLASQPNGSQLVHEDLEQIYEDDLEEMYLKWQLAFLSIRTRIFFQKTGRKITINGTSDEELEELMKDQLLPVDASPIALSLGYISDSDPEEDDEEDQRMILLTILPTEETMMIMSHLMMTTMIMMLRYGCLFNTILHDHHLPRTRGSRMALLITIRTNNSRTRGKILAGLTPQGTGRRNITADLSRCILNTTITIMVHSASQMLTEATRVWSLTLSDFPEQKNQNHENGGTGARGVVHALGGGETNQDHNDMEEDINA
ncbi:hypothetical protein Tco_0909556 [Tanacetum coccineum]|uniref:Uncharacterized protein n=1 Tax=Tanacetum coccineum TaxID=301880 RepID=A0ABQ5CTS9_9ASTR